MDGITLRILDGCERGRVYRDLRTPITIGREEGNTIQLNDERVSRFHVKIQEDNERLVLTDLESTNGTKVNGEDVQLRILRFGDLITIGRSVLLFGSREQIAARFFELRGFGGDPSEATRHPGAESMEALDFELNWSGEEELRASLQTMEPPDIPDRLSPAQAAQLCELLEYFHRRLRAVLASGRSTGDAEEAEDVVQMDPTRWQSLVDMQARLAEYLRQIADPEA